MKRTRANHLVLVNWKGVFYERYALNAAVTGLEGVNGAGKTTVMIAAYIVLLPDMSHLRFTNIGENATTPSKDKGIWGRLGEEKGRPSYAAIDFALPSGERLIAGVHLERVGESGEPQPFLIRHLAPSVKLQELFLLTQGDDEAVPELHELRENAGRLGGHLQQMNAQKYFAALFDAGVMPLRLGTDAERKKLNDMLRTSMTGGISRALTTELREFLLREETGLASTLQRMRQNLDACRRTRIEVQEARQLEGEIGGVHEAGHAMLVAAVAATKDRADDHTRRVREAQGARERAAGELLNASTAFDEHERTLAVAVAAHETNVKDLDDAKAAATTMEAALKAADELQKWIEKEAQTGRDEVAKRDARGLAKENKARRDEETERARDDRDRASKGLADFRDGLSELHRRAALHAQATTRLAEARAVVGNVETGELARVVADVEQRIIDNDTKRRELVRRVEDAVAHRREHAEALAALHDITQENVDEAVAYARANEALARLRKLSAQAARVTELRDRLDDARAAANSQASARKRASAVLVNQLPPNVRAVDFVKSEVLRVELLIAKLGRDERTAAIEAEQAKKDRDEAAERLRLELEREPVWRNLVQRADEIAAATGLALHDRATLMNARAQLATLIAQAKLREDELKRQRDALAEDARSLVAVGGQFDAALLRLRDELGAELLAGRFEDVNLEDAAALEARLGGLAHALIVDEPQAVANSIASRAGPDTVLLVPPEIDIVAGKQPASEESCDVVVHEGDVVRVTRVPESPRLGRRAREARAAELRDAAASMEPEIESAAATRAVLEQRSTDSDVVLECCSVWLLGDPTARISQERTALADHEQNVLRLTADARRLDAEAREQQPTLDALRELLGEAHYLDPPDYAALAHGLEQEHATALEAAVEVSRCSAFMASLERNILALKRSPLSEADVGARNEEIARLQELRDEMFGAAEALKFVRDHHEALGWTDAERTLTEREELKPALLEQLENAKLRVSACEASATSAQSTWEEATSDWQDAAGKWRAASQQVLAARERLSETGVADPNMEALVSARDRVSELDAAARDAGKRVGELRTESGRLEKARDAAATADGEAEKNLTAEIKEAKPAIERWSRLRDDLLRHALYAGEATEEPPGTARGHVNRVLEANKHKAVLTERLEKAQGGGAIVANVEAAFDGSEQNFGDSCLRAWLIVRDWLRVRLPTQMADVADLTAALSKLRSHLAGLEGRLLRQEGDLRGASEDVALGIEVQIRRARGQVARVTDNLGGVHFGTVDAIRVRLDQDEGMKAVLDALRAGHAQDLLFQPTMPIEAALDEIFRRYSGSGRNGGQRLLDYREYVQLSVEVQRDGIAKWDVVDPAGLSTGEAIGVGAAVMMVILSEWEREANALKGKRASGSLRFLFLDEANRLSADNLAILLSLCRELELQLLIAAPEIALAEGVTTYRLVRQKIDGRWVVQVSGRRSVAEA